MGKLSSNFRIFNSSQTSWLQTGLRLFSKYVYHVFMHTLQYIIKPICMASLTLIFKRSVGTLQPTRLIGLKFNWQSEISVREPIQYRFLSAPSHYMNQCWNIVNSTLGTNFNEIVIEINIISFKKINLKMSSGKWRPFCLGLNVLILSKSQNGLESRRLFLGERHGCAVFGALSPVRAIGHCVPGQERDLLWTNWLNWYVWSRVPVFEIQIFVAAYNSRPSLRLFYTRIDK